MAEKKRTSDSSEDKVLDDMTNDFDDVFSEIKDKNDVESKKNQLEEESAIRGIFGRIKKKIVIKKILCPKLKRRHLL